MVVCVFYFFTPVRFLNDLGHSRHCSLVYIRNPSPLEFNHRMSSCHCTWALQQGCWEPKRTHGDCWWKLFLMDLPSLMLSCPGYCAFQLLIAPPVLRHWPPDGLGCSFSHCADEMGWLHFLVVQEESLYRMKETGLPGFLVSEKESWYLEGWSNCSFLGVCQQAWHRKIVLSGSESTFCATETSPSIASVFLAGMFWKSTLPVGFWYSRELAGPQLGAIAGRGEERSCGSAASPGLGSHGFNSWLCHCLPVGRAWSGTLSNSVSQLLIAWYHIILKPQPLCSKMLHITWQPTALLVSSMGNLQGDIGPNQNPEAPGPPTLESGSCSFCEIENEVLQQLSQRSLIMLLWWNFLLCVEFL